MSTQKTLPLDQHVADAVSALETVSFALGRDIEYPTTSIYDVSAALQRCDHALAEVRKLLSESAEERERAADTPDTGNVQDLLAWAEAGAYRTTWLTIAYEHIRQEAERLQPNQSAYERTVIAKHAIAMLGLLRDAAEAHEGYEAVEALNRAITCLQALTSEAQHV